MDNVFGELFSSFWGLVLYILKAFSPLFIGLILAYILNGPVEWVRTVVLKKRKNIQKSIRKIFLRKTNMTASGHKTAKKFT